LKVTLIQSKCLQAKIQHRYDTTKILASIDSLSESKMKACLFSYDNWLYGDEKSQHNDFAGIFLTFILKIMKKQRRLVVEMARGLHISISG